MRKALTLLAATAALTACGSVPGTSGGKMNVVYQLESDAPTVSATYATSNGSSIGTQQDNAATPPWSKTVTAEKTFAKAFVLTGSMNPVTDGSGKDGTTITCRITVDGKVVAEQTSTGQYATVSCSSS